MVFDVDTDRLVDGRTCLIGDAGIVARPHAAAGTAKAGANAWALAEALAHNDSVPAALAAGSPRSSRSGGSCWSARDGSGTRSQVTCTWDGTDPDTLFRLREEGP